LVPVSGISMEEAAALARTFAECVGREAAGNPLFIPETLKACKAIGWYLREYGIARVSMNPTGISLTPVHRAFEEVCLRAETPGLRVTGSDLVGLVPKRAFLISSP
jgi:glutamate formiminotransferase/formiminotetrahydrofolate cyclodeaminase